MSKMNTVWEDSYHHLKNPHVYAHVPVRMQTHINICASYTHTPKGNLSGRNLCDNIYFGINEYLFRKVSEAFHGPHDQDLVSHLTLYTCGCRQAQCFCANLPDSHHGLPSILQDCQPDSQKSCWWDLNPSRLEGPMASSGASPSRALAACRKGDPGKCWVLLLGCSRKEAGADDGVCATPTCMCVVVNVLFTENITHPELSAVIISLRISCAKMCVCKWLAHPSYYEQSCPHFWGHDSSEVWLGGWFLMEI